VLKVALNTNKTDIVLKVALKADVVLKVALKADKVLKVAKKKKCYSVGNHFFQTLAKMASGLKQVLAKMN
jgi:hypothetical protein